MCPDPDSEHQSADPDATRTTGEDENSNWPSGTAAPDSELDQSKSARKREADRITLLGKTISELGEPDIRRLPLDTKVLEAVLALRRISAHGARKRQLLYLGKLLRHCDLAGIEQGLAQMQWEATAATRQFHAVETQRDLLLTGGSDALSAFLQQYPDSDRQHLRHLLRNAQREASAGKPPKARRELFKLLRDIMT